MGAEIHGRPPGPLIKHAFVAANYPFKARLRLISVARKRYCDAILFNLCTTHFYTMLEYILFLAHLNGSNCSPTYAYCCLHFHMKNIYFYTKLFNVVQLTFSLCMKISNFWSELIQLCTPVVLPITEFNLN